MTRRCMRKGCAHLRETHPEDGPCTRETCECAEFTLEKPKRVAEHKLPLGWVRGEGSQHREAIGEVQPWP